MGHGGYRHGRRRSEVAKLKALHTTIKAGNHELLQKISDDSGLTYGEIVDKLLERHKRRVEQKSLVQVKKNSLSEQTT